MPLEMNGTLNGTMPSMTDHPLVGRHQTPSDEPLDLSTPLDLSRKYQAETNGKCLDNPMRDKSLTNPKHPLKDSLPIRPAKFPILGAAKYPLQRGRAYVQPRNVKHPQHGDTKDSRGLKAQGDRQIDIPPERVQVKRSQDAMQQRLRAEAANIAALQAQATQAAQAAANKAAVRHALEVQALAHNAKQQSQNAHLSNVAQTQVQYQTIAGLKSQESRKRSYPEELTSLYQRHQDAVAANLQAMILQRHFSQKPIEKDTQREQDLLRAYRAMITPSGVATHPQKHHANPTRDDIGANSHLFKGTPITVTPSNSSTAKCNGMNHQYDRSMTQRKSVDWQIGYKEAIANKTATVDRDRELLRRQHEIILRQKRQLMEDLSKNRKLLEYAKRQKKLNAMIQDFNVQYAKHLKVQEKKRERHAHAAQRSLSSPHNQEYLAAVTAYNAARAELAKSSPPIPILLPHNIYAPEYQLHQLSRQNGATFSPVSTSPVAELPPAVARTANERPQGVHKAEKVPRCAAEDTAISSSSKQNTELDSRKNFRSVSVKDQFLMAQMSDNERRQFLIMSGYIHPSYMQNSHQPARSQSQTSKDHFDAKKYMSPRGKLSDPNVLRKQKQNVQMSTQNESSVDIAAQLPVGTRDVQSTKKPNGKQVVDLAGGFFLQRLSPDGTSDGSEHNHDHGKRVGRPPSYDDAVVGQRTLEDSTSGNGLNQNVISSMAKRLVSSSQEWVKKRMRTEKEPKREGIVDIVHDDTILRNQDIAETKLPSLRNEVHLNNQQCKSPPLEEDKHEASKSTETSKPTEASSDQQKNFFEHSDENKDKVPPPNPPGDKVHSQCPSETPSSDEVVKRFHDRIISKDPRKKHIATMSSNQQSARSLDETGSLSPAKPAKESQPLPDSSEVPAAALTGGLPCKEATPGATEYDLMQADATMLGNEERALQVYDSSHFNLPVHYFGNPCLHGPGGRMIFFKFSEKYDKVDLY